MMLVLGWFGSILYLLNHGYISLVKQWREKIYYTGNLIAALSLVISSLAISSYQAVVINGFWAVVSLLLLLQYDMTKLSFSKRAFHIGFLGFLTAIAVVGVMFGISSAELFTCMAWSSSFVFCLSYFLFCAKKLSHIAYLAFNVYAALALLPMLWVQQNWPVFTLEVCWAAISAYGIFAKLERSHLID